MVNPDARDGNREASGDATPDAPGCDKTQPPSANDCVLTDDLGVFVATTGSDSNDGTKAKPFATISHAVGALGGKSRVYVCNGSYTDQITIAAAVSVFGGMTCAGGTWAYATGTQGKVAGTSADFTLKVNGVTTAVDVEDLEFDGANATAPGQSSITVLAVGSTGVALHRVAVKGGLGSKGANGVDGTAAPNYTGASAPNGNAGTATLGGAAQPNSCTDATLSAGGGGGALVGDGQNGSPGYVPSVPASNTGTGGKTANGCGAGGAGLDGSYGPAGVAGTGAPDNGVFSLSLSAWVPSKGGDGGNGRQGQGGGGGAGKVNGGGGGGGPGGCGGAGGKAGPGGGASFALLSVNSVVTLANAQIVGGVGGDGGIGGNGQGGQAQGGGGAGGGTGLTGCQGGLGGFGAGGGGGGGGGGGLSAAVAYVGTKPAYGADSTLTPSAVKAAAGAGGSGGAGGGVVGVAGANGAAGVSTDAMQLPTQ